MTTTPGCEPTPFTKTSMGLDQVKATIRERMESLPGDAGQIAEFLLERGHTGKINGSCSCPLARYLGDQFGPGYTTRVDDLDYQATVLDGGADGRLVHAEPLSSDAIAFIKAFDAGEYPALIARDT